MAESLKHIEYVKKITTYMVENIPKCEESLIQVDLAEYESRTPKVIGGNIPDVYYKTLDTFVIGEAKTDNDIERQHTDEQINNYIREVRTGTHHQKHIILATSLFSFAMWKNKIVRMKRKENLNDITFHVIDNINHSFII